MACGPQLATSLPRAGGQDDMSSKETPSNYTRIIHHPGMPENLPSLCLGYRLRTKVSLQEIGNLNDELLSVEEIVRQTICIFDQRLT